MQLPKLTFDFFFQQTMRGLITLGLVVVITICGWQIVRLWRTPKARIGAFSYEKDGAPSKADGLAFAGLLAHDLRLANDLHKYYFAKIKGVAPIGVTRGRGGPLSEDQRRPARRKTPSVGRLSRDNQVLASIDGLGRDNRGQLEFPTLAQDFLPEMEIEVYGIQLTALMRSLSQWLQPERAIAGYVSERNNTYSIQYELRGWGEAVIPPEERQGAVSDARSKHEASFALACRLLRMLAGQQIHAMYFHTIRPDEFIRFSMALQHYRRFQKWRDIAGDQGELEKAVAELDAAATLLARIPDDVTFPFVHELKANVALDRKEDFDTIVAGLERYIRILTDRGLPKDKRAMTLLDDVKALQKQQDARVAFAAPTQPSRRSRPVRPGVSIATSTNTAGTVCCFVKIAELGHYLVTAGHVIEGMKYDPVLQPGPFDGGTVDNDTIAQLDYLPELKHAKGPIGPEACYALARMLDNVEMTNEIAGVGRIAGLRSDVAVGEKLRVFGRTSGMYEAVVTKVNVTLPINLGMGTVQITQLIELDQPTRPGDSGAPVIDAQTRLVGMVFAGDGKSTIVAPAAPAFAKHDLKWIDAP